MPTPSQVFFLLGMGVLIGLVVSLSVIALVVAL
jgi:hypothetical protein